MYLISSRLYFATFSPRYAARVSIELGMSHAGEGKMRLHTSDIHVDVSHGAADLARSSMLCRPAVRGLTTLIAGDAVECQISVFDGFSNPVTNSSLANFLELRAYDARGIRQGFTGFTWATQNIFHAIMTVRAAGLLQFNATLSYSSAAAYHAVSVERQVESGAIDTAKSKFVCPNQLDVFALTSFDCFFFLVDAFQNPKKRTYSERSKLHVKFGNGASPYDSSFIVRDNLNSMDDLSFDTSLGGIRAQYVATLNVAPASDNETSIELSGHLHQNDLSAAAISLVQTSPAELALYSAKMICQKKKISWQVRRCRAHSEFAKVVKLLKFPLLQPC